VVLAGNPWDLVLAAKRGNIDIEFLDDTSGETFKYDAPGSLSSRSFMRVRALKV
jgi:hypothetical protein